MSFIACATCAGFAVALMKGIEIVLALEHLQQLTNTSSPIE
jgi:hypothetical protein